jgi:hypothetical protein
MSRRNNGGEAPQNNEATVLQDQAEWAGAEAESLRRQASEMEKHPSGGSYSRAARKAESIRNLLAEARKFERMQRISSNVVSESKTPEPQPARSIITTAKEVGHTSHRTSI